MYRNLGLGLLATASTLTLAAAAQAQTDAPPPPQATAQQQQAASGGGTVLVTANKRQEQLHNVAQAVSAVTQQRVEQLQAFNFADYTKFVPGLTLVQALPGDNELIIRGLNSGGDAATVATYIDEAPYGSSNGLANGTLLAADIDAFDMQRIEVDKGPQGTLYGASTIGGLLKFVTNPPDPGRLAAEAEVGGDEVENAWGWAAKGMLNVPLGPNAALRVDGTDVQTPGFIRDAHRHLNDVNPTGEEGLRASFLWRPVSTVSIRLSAIAQNFDDTDLDAVDLKVNPATGVPLQPLMPAFGDLANAREISGFNHVQNRIYNGTLTWEPGWATLVSSTSYGTYNSQSLADTTAIFDTVEHANLDVTKFTEEDRLQSPAGQRLEWLAGVFYTRENSNLVQRLPAIGGPFSGLLVESAQLTAFYEEEAGFGTVTYHFTPQFDIAVGGRYAHNDQNSQSFVNILGGVTPTAGSSSDSTWTYSVAPRWRPNPDLTVYARIASGYQPGGPNDIAPGAPSDVPRTFGPDTDVSYEIGAKAELLDHTLSVDADVFHIDWNNIQLIAVIANTGVDVNGGRASSDGVEAQGVWTPVRGLTLSANGAYIDARLTTPTNALLGGKSGDPLPFTPKWSGTLDGAYTWPINGDLDAFVGATWTYIGDRKSSFSGSIGQVALPNYNTWDLRAGVNVGRMWTVEVFGKNLGDVRGISSLGGALSAAYVGQSVIVIQPRTVGVTLTARY